MGNAILNKLMNLLISLARDIVVPPLRPLCFKDECKDFVPIMMLFCEFQGLVGSFIEMVDQLESWYETDNGRSFSCTQ